MWDKWRSAFHSLTAIFFPPLCIHCQESLEDSNTLLCGICSQQLELIDSSSRCPRCFSPHWSPYRRLCGHCHSFPSPFSGLAATLEHIGPAATLVKKMKYGNEPYLARGAAALLVAQWAQLNWPLPDLIVPAPISPLHRTVRGYNQSALLATAMGKILGRPAVSLLRRHGNSWRQAGLSRNQRQSLSPSAFTLNSSTDIEDKRVLLIDDVLTTGTTLRCCAEALAAGYPQSIYGLCLTVSTS